MCNTCTAGLVVLLLLALLVVLEPRWHLPVAMEPSLAGSSRGGLGGLCTGNSNTHNHRRQITYTNIPQEVSMIAILRTTVHIHVHMHVQAIYLHSGYIIIISPSQTYQSLLYKYSCLYYCHFIKQFLTGQPPVSNKKRGTLETHVSQSPLKRPRRLTSLGATASVLK